MWQSFCYFGEETNQEILRQIYHKLTPGGRFVIDSYNREYYEQHQGSTRQEINGISIEASTRLQGQRLHTELRYSDEDGERGEDHFDWQLYTPAEFCALAAKIGFTPLLTCTWSDGKKAPSPDVARMQIVLEK
ncbi:MAG TPA: hypothetical protein VKR06_43100 [Ktedonosporobacter sp.]|nr:hypothetical protein [Ktedonosporobacter sp.]